MDNGDTGEKRAEQESSPSLSSPSLLTRLASPSFHHSQLTTDARNGQWTMDNEDTGQKRTGQESPSSTSLLTPPALPSVHHSPCRPLCVVNCPLSIVNCTWGDQLQPSFRLLLGSALSIVHYQLSIAPGEISYSRRSASCWALSCQLSIINCQLPFTLSAPASPSAGREPGG